MPRISARSRAKFAEALLRWGSRNRRSFPWRETRDPYKVLVAEILLQRTHARQARPVFEELAERYPSPAELARARAAEVRRIVRPLGLEKRGAALVRLARAIEMRHGGEVPLNRKDLLALPGVGPYVADALRCFALGEDVVPVDCNVARVLTRAWGLKGTRDEEVAGLASCLAPPGGARDLAFALLDLAAAVCRAQEPACAKCPVRRACERGMYGG